MKGIAFIARGFPDAGLRARQKQRLLKILKMPFRNI